MKPGTESGSVILAWARRLAGVLVPRALWPVIDDELQEELSERGALGWPRWRCELWGAWQYVSVGTRLLHERLGSAVPDRRALRGLVTGDGFIDLKQAARSLRSRTMVTLSVVVTIALAVGASTSVYTVVDGVLLRPLPYPESDRLARLWQTTARWTEVSESEFRADANRLTPLAPTYFDWLGVELGFEALGAYTDAAFILQESDGAAVFRGQEVTSGLFDALQIEPLLGRRLKPEDDAPDATPVVVLAESFWRDRFGADRSALGADLVLSGTRYAVVGVMPADFAAPASTVPTGSLPSDRPVLWTPLTDEARRGWKNVSVLGRLAPGVTVDAASERLTAFQDVTPAIYPSYQGAWAESLLDSVVGDVRATLWFLLGTVGLVLLVATVNIANVLAAAGLGRSREMAVRAALGAGSARLARGLLTESALLAVLGGLGGVALSWLTLPLLTRSVPPTLPRYETIDMGAEVLLFGLAVTSITALLTGVLPAISASRAHPHDALRSSGRSPTSGPKSHTIRSGLVVAELSLAFVLLVGATLLGHSYLKLWSVERGFATEGLVALAVVPDRTTFRTGEQTERFAENLMAELGRIPGVRATVANHLPLSGMRAATEMYLERPDGEQELLEVGLLTVVFENYFDVVGIPIVEGRGPDAGDTRDAQLVAVVSQQMAERYWPGQSPIGQHLRTYDDSTAAVEIVGVAGDVKHRGLAAEIEPTVYVPASQSGRATYMAILRIRGDIGEAIQSARAVVSGVSASTPVRRVIVLEEVIAESVAIPRFRTTLVLGLAALAAFLSLLGVYGVVSYTVAQSAKEIGVRMALGAHSGDEVRRVLGTGLKLGNAGVAVGFVMAWSLSDVLSAFLFEITPTDPATYVLVVVGILVVSTGAAYVPARRAATVQPVTVLNSD